MQARHLRAVRAAAVERETSLIEQVVAPTLRQRSPGSRDRAGQTAREIAALSLRLHAALMDSALAEAGSPDASRARRARAPDFGGDAGSCRSGGPGTRGTGVCRADPPPGRGRGIGSMRVYVGKGVPSAGSSTEAARQAHVRTEPP